jgi:phenylpyruvate tautomerase PptA (4-oxalocrotonate tautomerase family)
MPILEVEVVLKDGEGVDPRAAARIADAAAAVFGAPPGNTWVRVMTLLFSVYAEDAGGPPDGVFPVFVSVLLRARCGGPGETACEAERLTHAIAPILERSSENVHILYEPDGAGQVSFGGSLVGT